MNWGGVTTEVTKKPPSAVCHQANKPATTPTTPANPLRLPADKASTQGWLVASSKDKDSDDGDPDNESFNCEEVESVTRLDNSTALSSRCKNKNGG